MFFVTLQINLDKSILPVSMETFDQYKITSFICIFVTLLLQRLRWNFKGLPDGSFRSLILLYFATKIRIKQEKIQKSKFVCCS